MINSGYSFSPRDKADFTITFTHNGEDVEITGKGEVELEQDYTYQHTDYSLDSYRTKQEPTVSLNNVEGFNMKVSKSKLPVEHTARVKVDKITPKNVEKARAAAGVDKNCEFRVIPNWQEAAIKMPSDTYTIEFRWTA